VFVLIGVFRSVLNSDCVILCFMLFFMVVFFLIFVGWVFVKLKFKGLSWFFVFVIVMMVVLIWPLAMVVIAVSRVTSEDERLRRVYIDYFSHAGAKDDIPLLKTVQDDVEGNLSIRLSAAQAIAVLGGTIDYALVDSSLSSANHQKDAIRILAFSSNLGDVSRLEPFLARQGELRDEAKVAMGRITIVNSDLSIPEKRTRLFQYLNDDSDRVRFWSAEQLLFLSSMDPSILVELKNVATDPNQKASSSVATVLTINKVVSDEELLKIMEEKGSHVDSGH
jgi:HEAT repeat protein